VDAGFLTDDRREVAARRALVGRELTVVLVEA